MSKCQSCGRPIKASEAYKRITVGNQTFFLCCPMCLDALQAGQVLRRMIPKSFSEERISAFIEYIPAMQIGGDYACIRFAGENRLYAVVADVSGHGIASSLVMSRISAEIERFVQAGENVTVISETLNKAIFDAFGQDRYYLTLFGSVIDFSTQTITYTNCGHPAQFLWRQKERKIIRLESQNMPVGLFGSDIFGTPQKNAVSFQAGDKLLLYSDGCLEIFGEDDAEFEESKLLLLFEELIETPAEQIEHYISERIRTLHQLHGNDDLLLIYITFLNLG